MTASRDPDDNKFLEAALAGKADYVVTGDKDLRDLEGQRIFEEGGSKVVHSLQPFFVHSAHDRPW